MSSTISDNESLSTQLSSRLPDIFPLPILSYISPTCYRVENRYCSEDICKIPHIFPISANGIQLLNFSGQPRHLTSALSLDCLTTLSMGNMSGGITRCSCCS